MKNLVQLLFRREIGFKTDSQTQSFGEERCARDLYHEIKCSVPSHVRSTFVLAFSPHSVTLNGFSGQCVASAHGDHRIYLFDIKSGRKLKTLVGHSRTPWTLVWHPSNSNLLASGCLAGEIRIWFLTQHNCSTVYCVDTYNVNTCVASLAFHPLERFIVIATSNEMHYWDWAKDKPVITLRTGCEQQRIRLVRFSPNNLITGISNLPQMQYSNESMDRKHSLLSRIVGIYRENNNNRLQSLMESIDEQLVSNDHFISNSISTSLSSLQSLLQCQSTLPNINQIKSRISQIVEKLLSLTHCSEENQIRQQMSQSSNESDCLAYCLWLIEKAIQLSRLMSFTSSTNVIPRVVIESVPSNPSNSGDSSVTFRPRSPPLNEMQRTMASNSRSFHYMQSTFNLSFPLMTSTNPSLIDFRLQCWPQNQIPNIKDSNVNIIAAKVRIHNDASVDISRDGQLLVCLVPNTVNCVNLSLYSLSPTSFGHLLCQWTNSSNAISVSLSRTSQFIVVGISRTQVMGTHCPQMDTIAQIFKRKSSELLEHIRNVEILRSDSITSVNSIRFMPNCDGIIFGTNRGQLIILRN